MARTVTGDGITDWGGRPGAKARRLIRGRSTRRCRYQRSATVSRDKGSGDTGRRGSKWGCPERSAAATLQGHTGTVLSVAFSSNGQKMATGSADGTARTWTVPLPPIPAATLQNITAAVPARAAATPARPRRILVVWRADAILHKGGVPAVNHAIELMSKHTGAFEADFTRDVAP